MKELLNKIKTNLLTPAGIYNILLYAILVIIPVIPFKFTKEYSHQLQITFNLSVGFILIMFIFIFKKKIDINKQIKFGVVNYLVLAYTTIITISAFASKYFPETLTGSLGRSEGLATLYMYLFLFMITYYLFKPNKYLFKCMAISSIFVSTYGIVQALFNLTRYSYAGTSTFGNPNFFSTYINICLPIYLVLYLRKGDWLYFISSLFLFAGLVCTKTTGAYICFIIYFIIILIHAITKKVKFKKIITLVMCFVVIFSVLCHYTNNKYFKEIFIQLTNDFKRIITITTTSDASTERNIIYIAKASNISLEDEIKDPESSKLGNLFEQITGLKRKSEYMLFNKRGYIYHLCFEILKDGNLWLGLGPDCLGQEVLDNYITTDEYKLYYPYQLVDKAHSEYLQVAVSTGIISLVIYLAILILVSAKLLKRYKLDKHNPNILAIGMSVFAYLVQAAFNISVTHVAPLFWIMLGIALSVAEKGYKEN